MCTVSIDSCGGEDLSTLEPLPSQWRKDVDNLIRSPGGPDRHAAHHESTAMRQPNRFGIILGTALLLLLTAIQVTPSAVSADANETASGSANASQQASITAGPEHTCVVLTIGAVKCWGSNHSGELGDNTTIFRFTPANVAGLTTGAAAVTSGGDVGSPHTCALLASGAAKCWGVNWAGQLGDNTTTNKLIPTDVTGLSTGVTAITAGMYHTCALLADGAVKCWGENGAGQLGDNTTTNKLIPTDVAGLSTGVTAISAGSHTCARLTTGAAKCWGENTSGQLGDNTTNNRLVPADVTGLTDGVAAISAGIFHTCALLTTGAAKCWGDNLYGRLGDNTTNNKLLPTDVTGLSTGVTAITTGFDHTCALLTTGAAKCWGQNSQGQVGASNFGNHIIPTDVTGLTTGVGLTTTTSSTTTSTTLAPLTTTTTAIATTTTIELTTTTIVSESTLVKKTAIKTIQLPATGSDSSPLIAFAIALSSAGLLLIARKRLTS